MGSEQPSSNKPTTTSGLWPALPEQRPVLRGTTGRWKSKHLLHALFGLARTLRTTSLGAIQIVSDHKPLIPLLSILQSCSWEDVSALHYLKQTSNLSRASEECPASNPHTQTIKCLGQMKKILYSFQGHPQEWIVQSVKVHYQFSNTQLHNLMFLMKPMQKSTPGGIQQIQLKNSWSLL